MGAMKQWLFDQLEANTFSGDCPVCDSPDSCDVERSVVLQVLNIPSDDAAAPFYLDTENVDPLAMVDRAYADKLDGCALQDYFGECCVGFCRAIAKDD
jgi:hypothetical protein